jgi:hypothetical protein
VDPGTGTNRAAVSIPGDHEHVQVGPAEFHSTGHREGTAVKTVKTIGVHIMWKTGGATDPRDEHGLFRFQLFFPQESLGGIQDGVVPASRTPSGYPFGIVFKVKIFGRKIQ